MQKKYYAVKKGRQTGLFNTWEECEKQVKGFSGAEYKSFADVEDAASYLGMEKKPDAADKDLATAYVDGSYNIRTGEFSCGVVIFHNGSMYELSKKFDDRDLSEMRNVAGEIKGAELAIRFCLDRDVKSLEIFYDYEGIAKWGDRKWKTNKKGTTEYADFCQRVKRDLKIKFTKVKGHSGNKYNDRADRLAKDALGIQ